MASLLGLSAILLLFGAIQCLRPPLDELLDLVDQNVIINPKFRRGDGIHSERNATAVKQPNTAERLSKHFELIHFRPREGEWHN